MKCAAHSGVHTTDMQHSSRSAMNYGEQIKKYSILLDANCVYRMRFKELINEMRYL